MMVNDVLAELDRLGFRYWTEGGKFKVEGGVVPPALAEEIKRLKPDLIAACKPPTVAVDADRRGGMPAHHSPHHEMIVCPELFEQVEPKPSPAHDLLADLERQDFALRRDGDRLLVKGDPPPDFAARIRQHKTGLCSILWARERGYETELDEAGAIIFLHSIDPEPMPPSKLSSPPTGPADRGGLATRLQDRAQGGGGVMRSIMLLGPFGLFAWDGESDDDGAFRYSARAGLDSEMPPPDVVQEVLRDTYTANLAEMPSWVLDDTLRALRHAVADLEQEVARRARTPASPEPARDGFLTAAEVAKELGTGTPVSRVYKLIREGRLRAHRLGRRKGIRISAAEVGRFKAQ